MSALQVVAAAVGVGAGAAIVLLALAVIIEVDLATGGRWWGLGWFIAATLGGALALQSLAGPPPDALTLGMGVVFAVLGWRYRALLRMESRKPHQVAEQRAQGL